MLETDIKNLDDSIIAKQLMHTSGNPLYAHMDEKTRKTAEQKDGAIVQLRDKIEQTKRKISDLRNNQGIESILAQHKGNK